MHDLLKVLGGTALALAVIAGAILYGRDTTIMVPVPEAVAEDFTRQVATRRYDRALQYIDNGSAMTLVNVRLAGEALRERAGAIDRVEGEPGRIEGNQAAASAVMTTEQAGRIRYWFRFTRRNGLWKIIDWQEHRMALRDS